MYRARPVALFLLTVVLSACGSQNNSQRPAVAHYIRSVQTIENGLNAPLAAVTKAGTQLASAPKHTTLLGNLERAGNEQTLAASLAKIRAAKSRIAGLPTPIPAQHLRSLLLSLTASEADLTRQLRLLAVFLPHFSAALAPLGPATLSLERVLSQTQAYGSAAVSALYSAKAQALRHFQAVTDAIATRLHRLTPPRVSVPQYRAELTSLRGMGTASGHLAGALGGGSPANVAPLLAAFDRAAAATRTRSAQRAQIAAIKAYNASSARLNRLSAAVAEERLRLSNSLS
jgi:hypothetical protein